MTPTDNPPIDYSRKWFAMAAVAMGIFLATIDGSIVNIALVTLVRELETTFATVQWVVLSYLLTLATLMLSIGRLADIRGKKTIYVTGFGVFTVGSLLCGLAPTAGWLIALRILQGIGAAMILALGPAILTEAFPPGERGKALGLSGAIVSLGIMTGPTVGGLIINSLSWHWIFFVNIPIGILGIVMAWRFVPAIRPPGGQRFDFVGAVVFCISLLSFLLATTLGQELGYGTPFIVGLFALWLVCMGVFILVELKVAQPMLDLSLFRNELFTVNLITGFMTFVATAGTLLLLPFYLQNVLGYSVQQAGLLQAVTPIILGVVAPVSGMLSDRVGSRRISIIGLVFLGIAYAAVSTLTTATSALGYVLRVIPIGIGMGMFQSPNNSAIMGSAPRQRLGVASSLISIMRTLGQTTGIAVLGALWATRVTVYSGGVTPGGATSAAPAVQVQGLQDVARLLVVWIGVAVLISAWGLIRERRVTQELHAGVGQPGAMKVEPGKAKLHGD